jgi:hypothetical protein
LRNLSLSIPATWLNLNRKIELEVEGLEFNTINTFGSSFAVEIIFLYANRLGRK